MGNITNNGKQDALAVIAVDANGDYIRVGGSGVGTGDVTGPASATANALAVYNGTTGQVIKDSAITLTGSDLANVDSVTGGTLTLESSTGAVNVNASTDFAVTTTNGVATITSSGQSLISSQYATVGLNAKTNITLAAGYGGGAGNINLFAPAGDVNVNGDTSVDITSDSGDVTITAPAGNVIISGLTVQNQIGVNNGGGFVSNAAGQEINLSASSGITIGGGSGPIALGTTNSQVSMSTGDGAGGTGVFSAYPTSATMQVSESGQEQYISILTPVNNIWTKGNFRPETSGTNSIGLVTAPYSGVVALNVVTQSPNGSYWRLAVDNAGVVSGVSFP